MANIYGRQVVVPLVNKSGGSVAAGDVVIGDTTNDGAFTTTTSGAYTGLVGVAQETIASNATGRVLTAGYAALVNVNASVTRGQYGKTHTVVKQATGTASRGVGTFCQWLTGGTTPTALVYAPDLNAAAVTVATDSIWDAAGDLVQGTGADTAAKLTAGTAGMMLKSAGAAAANLWAYPPGYEFTKTDVTSVVTATNVAEASAPTVVSAGAVTYDGSTSVYIEWFFPQVYGPPTANTSTLLTLWEDSTDLGIVAEVRSETTNRGVTAITGSYKKTPTNASHNYTIKAHATGTSGGVGGGAGGAGNLVAGYCRVVKA